MIDLSAPNRTSKPPILARQIRPTHREQFILDLHDEIFIDNFAGGGGASTGYYLATGRHVDVAINHNAEALGMHAFNHPQTVHLQEDVWGVDIKKVVGNRRIGGAWFSPDCKDHSKAKGGKPRSKKIRGLAWVAVKWAGVLPAHQRPRVIYLENVEEFQQWGPLVAIRDKATGRVVCHDTACACGWRTFGVVNRCGECDSTKVENSLSNGLAPNPSPSLAVRIRLF